jgi:hypothetical protein
MEVKVTLEVHINANKAFEFTLVVGVLFDDMLLQRRAASHQNWWVRWEHWV